MTAATPETTGSASRSSGRPRTGWLLPRFTPTTAVVVIFVALLILYFGRQPSALSSFGILTLSDEYTALALAAVGETFVVVMGGIDLSVGAVMAVVNTLLTVYMGRLGISIVVLALAVAAMCGVINGVFVAFLRLPSIIVTLATMFVWTGVALLILPQPGGSVPEAFVTNVTGAVGPVPVALIILVLLVALSWYFVRSRFGMAVFAVGGNEQAAHMAGMKVAILKLAAFALSGFFYGLAGVFLTAQTGAGDPNLGATFLLEAFAAVAVGGTAFGGGRGSLVGSVFGALVLGIITDVLLSLGVSSFATPTFYGLLLFITVALASPKLRRQLRALRRPVWLGPRSAWG